MKVRDIMRREPKTIEAIDSSEPPTGSCGRTEFDTYR